MENEQVNKYKNQPIIQPVAIKSLHDLNLAERIQALRMHIKSPGKTNRTDRIARQPFEISPHIHSVRSHKKEVTYSPAGSDIESP